MVDDYFEDTGCGVGFSCRRETRLQGIVYNRASLRQITHSGQFETMLFSNRRAMLQQTTVAGALAAGLAAAARASRSHASELSQPLVLPKDATILFQGDSITDVRRDRKRAETANDAKALGDGYPLLIASELVSQHPQQEWKVFNRGISGNRVPSLLSRWQADCIDLQPALLSVLIGVNDIWHKMNGDYDGTVETYRTGYLELIDRTKENLPDTRIVICEPFVLRCGAVKDSWFPEFDQRRSVAKEVAKESNAIWVPFQTMFDEAVAAGTKPEYWLHDGVHPTLAGHALMAQTWRKILQL